MQKIVVMGLIVAAWGLCALEGRAEEASEGAAGAASEVVKVIEVEGSDLIGRIGYDAGKQIAYVQMLYSTDWYGYEGVPPEVFEAFQAAESKGAFFNTQLKGKYPTHRWEW